MMTTLHRTSRGLTLVELMVTLSILAIIVGIGAPSFLQTLGENRVRNAANDLLYSLQMARSEALKRNVDVLVCPSTDQSSCVADSTNWASGWVVRFTEGGVTTVLQVQNALNASITATGPTGVSYTSAGYLSPATAQSFAVSNSSTGSSRGVCVTTIGQSQVKKPSC